MRIEIPVTLRWSDVDAYGHVNNVNMLRLLEIARIDAFWTTDEPGYSNGVLDASPGSESAMFVAHQEIEYLQPLNYRKAPVIVEIWLSKIGGASVEVNYVVRDAVPAQQPQESQQLDPVVYANASTTLVIVDGSTGRPRKITDDERATWQQFVEEPIRFKRRR
ncbi:thioesterase family protein [Timonella senegalensis]|uniref:acyl-CoA thioesterase n=1 Tax=Timonella senegalensis TaxID=1465825 RepID=UPI002FDDD0E3